MSYRVQFQNMASDASTDTVWVDVETNTDAMDIEEALQSLAVGEDSEDDNDYRIMGCEGFGNSLASDLKNENVEALVTVLEQIEEHSLEVVEHALDCCRDVDSLADYITDNAEGFYESKAEWAKTLCDGVGYLPHDLPAWIANHIDWEGVAGELEHDYVIIEVPGGFVPFRNV